MTIHGDHPFLPPESERSPVRRLRGRVGSGVSVWTSGTARERSGLTVSSLLVADGEPARVLGLVDPQSSLWEALGADRRFVVNLLSWPDRGLADAFAGLAPAPGGVFKLGSWQDSQWGPVLESAPGWAGCVLVGGEPREVGWALLVEATMEHVELPDETEPGLAHRRGRYYPLG